MCFFHYVEVSQQWGTGITRICFPLYIPNSFVVTSDLKICFEELYVSLMLVDATQANKNVIFPLPSPVAHTFVSTEDIWAVLLRNNSTTNNLPLRRGKTCHLCWNHSIKDKHEGKCQDLLFVEEHFPQGSPGVLSAKTLLGRSLPHSLLHGKIHSLFFWSRHWKSPLCPGSSWGGSCHVYIVNVCLIICGKNSSGPKVLL